MATFTALLPLAFALLAALVVTGLFVYGAWLLLRAPSRARVRILQLARSLKLIARTRTLS